MSKLSDTTGVEISTVIVLCVLVLVLSMLPYFSCTLRAYPSVIAWWTDGHAQLRPGCGDSFGRGDPVSSFFESVSRFAEPFVLPAWNTIMSIDLLRLVLPLLALALLGSVLYDLLKNKWNAPVSR